MRSERTRLRGNRDRNWQRLPSQPLSGLETWHVSPERMSIAIALVGSLAAKMIQSKVGAEIGDRLAVELG